MMNANLLFQKVAPVQNTPRRDVTNPVTQGKSGIEDKDAFRRLLEKVDGKYERPGNTKSAAETRQTSSQPTENTAKAGDSQDAGQVKLSAAQVLMALLLNLFQETEVSPDGSVEVNDSATSGQPAVLSTDQVVNLLQTLPESMKKGIMKLAQLLDGSVSGEQGEIPEVLKGLPLPQQADLGELAQWLQTVVSRLEEDQQANAAVAQVKDSNPVDSNPVPVLEAAAAPVQKTGEAKDMPQETVSVDTATESSREATLAGTQTDSEDSHKGEQDSQSKPDVSWLKTVAKTLDAAGVRTGDSVANGAMNVGNVKLPVDQAAPMPEVVVTHNGRLQPELLVKPVIQHASLMLQEGVSEMRLQLVPENLGKVHLQISVRDGLVSAKMTVDNEQVRAIMETNLSQLKDALQEQGLQLGGFSVACGQQQGGQWAAQEREAMMNSWTKGNRAKAEESYQQAGNLEDTPSIRRSVWSEGVVDALV